MSLAAFAVAGAAVITGAGVPSAAFAGGSSSGGSSISACDPNLSSMKASVAQLAQTGKANAGLQNMLSHSGKIDLSALPQSTQDFLNAMGGLYVEALNASYGNNSPTRNQAGAEAALQDAMSFEKVYGESYSAGAYTNAGPTALTAQETMASKFVTDLQNLVNAYKSGDANAISQSESEIVLDHKDANFAIGNIDATTVTFTNGIPATECSLATTLVNGSNGTKYLSQSSASTAIDNVQYPDVTVGQKYTIVGDLVDKKTGKDTGITATQDFTPTSSRGIQQVSFNIPAGDAGTYVAFEKLYANGVLLATHADINDAAQTIYRVGVTTTATDAADNDKTVVAGGKIKDVVGYDDLAPSTKYTEEGVLMDKKTGKTTGITATQSFTSSATGSGTTPVVFNIPANENSGSLVAFETIKDENGNVVATHADINSAAQTVMVSPATKYVVVTYESDGWKLNTAKEVATANRVIANHEFAYREDVVWSKNTNRVSSAPLWPVSHWTIGTVTVNVPVNATAAQQLAMEKSAVAKATGVNAGIFVNGVKGKTLHTSWIIPNGGWNNRTSWINGPKTAAHIEVGSVNK